MCLAQGHNTATLVRIELRPLAPESDALPLRHRASHARSHINVKPNFISVYIVIIKLWRKCITARVVNRVLTDGFTTGIIGAFN